MVSSCSTSFSLSAGRFAFNARFPRALAERVCTGFASSTSDVAGVSPVATDSGLELKTGDAVEAGVVATDNEDSLCDERRVAIGIVMNVEKENKGRNFQGVDRRD